MNYIKTKDGIWERNDVGGLTYGYRPFSIGGWEHTSPLSKEQIIGEATEIVKLCDLFVAISKDGKHDIYAYESKLPTNLLDNDVYITNLYGAIWTKKGLKYVAEYKNGKWELI